LLLRGLAGVLAGLAVAGCAGAGERVRVDRVETDIVDFERAFVATGDVLVGVRWGESDELDEQVVTSPDGHTWTPVDLPGVPAGRTTSLRTPYVREGRASVNGEIVDPASRGALDPDLTTYVWSTADGRTWARTGCPRVLGCNPPFFDNSRFWREQVSLDGGRTVEGRARFGTEEHRLPSGALLATATTFGNQETEYAHLVRSVDGGRSWRSVVRDRCPGLASTPTGIFRNPVRLDEHWIVVHGCFEVGDSIESAIYLGDAGATTFRTISRSPHALGQPVVLGDRVFVPEQVGREQHFVIVTVD
jgi:hypothetical protein